MIDSTKTLEEISEHQGARRKAHSTSWQDRTCYKNLTTRQEADFKPGLISVANFSCHSHRRGTWVWLVLHLSNKIKRNESNTLMHFCTATLTRLFTDAHFTVSERRWYQTRRAAKVQSVQRQSVEQETLRVSLNTNWSQVLANLDTVGRSPDTVLFHVPTTN